MRFDWTLANKKYHLQLRWWVLWLLLLGFFLLLSLGYWQLQRAAYKRQLLSEYQARQQLTPINLNHSKQFPQDLHFYPAIVRGHYDNQHQFLLDNKIYQHQLGYQVLTPLRLADQSTILLVNRGWIAQPASRDQLPDIKTSEATVTLKGIIYVPDNKVFKLGSLSTDNIWPRRIQYLDIKTLNQLTGYHFYPFVLILDEGQSSSYVKNWSPLQLNVNLHYGYAVQWFAIALAFLIVALIFHIRPED